MSNKIILYFEMEENFCSVFMIIISEFLVFTQSQMRDAKNVFRNYVYSKTALQDYPFVKG
jgi:hypothetical protein